MSIVNQRIKQAIERNHFSYGKMEELTGINKGTIYRYATTGTDKISMETIEKISSVCKVSKQWLLGWSDTPEIQYQSIGTVAAGYGHEAIERTEDDFFSIPEEVLKGHSEEDFTMLTVKGDSMLPDYQNGDHLLILRQPKCENGQVAVVIYGEETNGTLKKVFFESSSVILKPINDSYDEIIIKGSQLDYFKIVGIPKYLTRII